MELSADLDTVTASLRGGGGRALFGGFATFGTVFVAIGLGFLGAWLTPSLTDPAFPMLGGIFTLIGGVHSTIGWAGFIPTLWRMEVRVELHEVEIETSFAGRRTQHITARLSDLEEVFVDGDALRLRGAGTEHAVSLSRVPDEDRESLAQLLAEAVGQRGERRRRPPAELVALVKGRMAR